MWWTSIRQLPERHRFVRGLRSWVGFRQTRFRIRSCANDRLASRKYTLSKLLMLALDGLFTFSETPLRLATVVGAFVATASFVLGGQHRLSGDCCNRPSPFPDSPPCPVACFFWAASSCCVWASWASTWPRVHNEVMARPIYIVDRHIVQPSENRPQSSDDQVEQELERDLQALLPTLDVSAPLLQPPQPQS